MRPNSAAFDTHKARGAAFACMGRTHIGSFYARTIASRPTNARRGMRSASRSTAHNQKAQQATNTCTRVRACVAPQPAEHSPPPGRGLPHRLQHDFPGEAQAGTGQAKGFVEQAKGFGRLSRASEGILFGGWI